MSMLCSTLISITLYNIITMLTLLLSNETDTGKVLDWKELDIGNLVDKLKCKLSDGVVSCYTCAY